MHSWKIEIETEKAIYDEDLSALKLQMADYEKELAAIETS